MTRTTAAIFGSRSRLYALPPACAAVRRFAKTEAWRHAPIGRRAGIVVEFLVRWACSHFSGRLVRLLGGERFSVFTRRMAGLICALRELPWGPFGVPRDACDVRSNVAA